MKNTESAKTLTASLPHDAQALFAWIAEPDNLSRWHSSFCRSVRKTDGALIVESPRGAISTRFIRDDHSLVLDILAEVVEGIELAHALRVLRNGDGSELIWTLVKPDGISDSVFHEQVRWAGSALQNLRKARLSEPAERRAPEPGTDTSEGPPAAPPEATGSTEESADSTPAAPLTGKKLFIGNLPYDWTDEQLKTQFAEQGTVVIAEIARFRGRGGRSRGFGFVEMTTDAEAQTAIEKLHGGMAGGRQMIVRLSRSQESRPPASGPAAAASTDQPASASEDAQPASLTSTETPKPSPRLRPRAQPQRARRAPRRNASPASGRSYNNVDYVNKSGYEIFPRRSSKTSSPEPSSPPERPSRLADSPYMDDTGDIENHGHRPPSRPPRRRR